MEVVRTPEQRAAISDKAGHREAQARCSVCYVGRFAVWLKGWVVVGRAPCPCGDDGRAMIIPSSALHETAA